MTSPEYSNPNTHYVPLTDAGPTSTLRSRNYSILIFCHLKLCVATAIHNFKWQKIARICELLVKAFLNTCHTHFDIDYICTV